MSTRLTGDLITPTAHAGTPTIRGVELATCKSGLHRNVQAQSLGPLAFRGRVVPGMLFRPVGQPQPIRAWDDRARISAELSGGRRPATEAEAGRPVPSVEADLP